MIEDRPAIGQTTTDMKQAALPPVRSEPLLADFRDGWMACRRKMISEYGEACRSGCDPSGAWDCAKEETAEPDTANAALRRGEPVASNGVVGGGHCRHKWWHVGWRNKPGEIDVCWCSHCGALRRSGKPGKRRAQFNRPSNTTEHRQGARQGGSNE